jgi:hypothetical protein
VMGDRDIVIKSFTCVGVDHHDLVPMTVPGSMSWRCRRRDWTVMAA